MTTAAQHLSGSPEAHNARQERTTLIGMAIFLGSWAMLFAALFFSYALLRVGAKVWPPAGLPHLPLLVPGLATGILTIGSIALHRGYTRWRHNGPQNGSGDQSAPPAGYVFVALVATAGFLVLQTLVWQQLYTAGLTPSAGTYGSVFYGFTVFFMPYMPLWAYAPLLGASAYGPTPSLIPNRTSVVGSLQPYGPGRLAAHVRRHLHPVNPCSPGF